MTCNGQPLYGAHMSTAGGLWRAFEHAAALRCTCVQLFVKNQQQWNGKPLLAEEVQRFHETARSTAIAPVVAHAGYLINIASPGQEFLRRSTAALIDEVERCTALGVPDLVLHPGAHLGAGEAQGLKRAARTLSEILRSTGGAPTRILLETTAGQGTALGYRLDHLEAIQAEVAAPERLGVCLDTCHLFAAGYDLRKEPEYLRLISDLKRHVGLSAIRCVHVNDSAKPCGSRVDRHAHLGRGRIGTRHLARLVADPSFARVPMILETPKGPGPKDTDWDEMNLNKLRRMLVPRPLRV
jgi:deoxyribonuclease-4